MDAMRAECERLGIRWIPQRFRPQPKVIAPALSMLRMVWLVRREVLGQGARLMHARSLIPASTLKPSQDLCNRADQDADMIHRTTQKCSHNQWLDWLRFAAAFVVLITHARDVIFVEFSLLAYESQNLLTATFYGMTRLGTEAVIVFFVLSGFLVGGPAFERAKQGTFDLRQYTVDRAVRILVPLYPTIFLTLIVAILLKNEADIFLKTIGHLLSLQGAFSPLLHNNIPLWSLTYEVWFYILCGSLAYFFLGRRVPLKGKVLCAVALSFAAVVFSQLKIVYLVIWFLGAAAYLYRPTIVHKKWILLGSLTVLGGVALRQFFKPSSFLDIGPDGLWYGEMVAELIVAIGACLVIANAFIDERQPNAFGTLGSFLASFSFSLYLIHHPILRLWPVHDLSTISSFGLVNFCVIILICLVLALGYSRVFETSSAKIKAKIASRKYFDLRGLK
jgi:peptidoglycan/LPS O-acetylase OafA/YrhL